MSLLYSQLTDLINTYLLQQSAPHLYAFYRSSAMQGDNGILALLKQHNLQHAASIRQVKLHRNKITQMDPNAWLLLQELARPAAIFLRSQTPDYPLVYKNAVGDIEANRKQCFEQELERQKNHSKQELEIACLFSLAETVARVVTDYEAYKLPPNPTPEQLLNQALINKTKHTLSSNVMSAIFDLPPFAKPSEARLKLLTVLDESYCVYAAVKYIVINDALKIFHEALKAEELKFREERIKHASPQCKPALEKEYRKTQTTISASTRAKIINMIETARVGGWKSVDFRRLETLNFTTRKQNDQIHAAIETLRYTDDLELHSHSGFEAAIKLEQRAPGMVILPKSMSRESNLARMFTPSIKQASYCWQLTHNLKATHKQPISFFNKLALDWSENARKFQATKKTTLETVIKEVGDTLHPDRQLSEEQLTQKISELKELLIKHLAALKLEQQKQNPILRLLGDEMIINSLKNAINFIEKTSRAEAAPQPLIPRAISQ